MESNDLYRENLWNSENRKIFYFFLHNPFLQYMEIIRI